MALQEAADAPLILLRSEGTGGVDQPSAGPHHIRRAIQNQVLSLGAHLHVFFAPFLTRLFLPAEHPLPGAGRVHQHPVEIAREALRQPFRRLAGHHGVGNSHPLHVFRQDLRPGGMDLVAEQNPLPAHGRPDLRSLSARRGAQIQHPFPGTGVQEGRGRHGAGLLNIIDPGLVPGMFSRLILLSVIKTVSLPGNLP